jgi:ubiquinone biosynthesis monooxygenase Coq7
MNLTPALPTQSALGNRILKVDHAGEQGAICVYRAQLAVARLTAPSMRDQLADFLLHEKRHRSIFGAALMKRGLSRCRSYALCSLGGYVLGAVTALLGRKAIAATTIAIESVVLRHLAEQCRQLELIDPEAAEIIAGIVDDEQLHHDRSLDQIDIDRTWLRGLTAVVSQATEAAIWLGMKL